MLEAFLFYLGDTQREGTFVTRRIKTAITLRVLAGIFFLVAFVAAIVAGAIYLSKELGPGPAALVIAGVSFLLGVIMLFSLAMMRRPPRAYSARPTVSPISAAPLAAQTLAAGALRTRPFVTLLVAVAMGYIATRTTVRKKK